MIELYSKVVAGEPMPEDLSEAELAFWERVEGNLRAATTQGFTPIDPS